MMEFCTTCGILLDLEVIGKSNKCRPCRIDHEGHVKSIAKTNRPCECLYCKRGTGSGRSGAANEPKRSESKSSVHERANKSKKPKPTSENKKKARPVPNQIQPKDEGMQDSNGTILGSEWDRNVSISHSSPAREPVHDDWGMTMDTSHSASKSVFEDWGTSDWGTSALDTSHPSGDWDISDQPSSNSHRQAFEDLIEKEASHSWVYMIDHEEYSKPDWIEVRKKKHSHQMFGDHDFPTLQRGLKESDIEDGIREEWERLQGEYKEQLTMTDTRDIARLVSGHRRKADGKRFYVGGVDISFLKDDHINACACLSVLQMPNLELVYQSMEMIRLSQPYIPGFLAFREIPPLMMLFEKLVNDCPQYIPDVIMVDGNGTLHPRGFGLACQLGVVLDIPTIGIAKTLISAQGIVDDDTHKAKKRMLNEAGDGFDLISQDNGQVLGKCVRVHDKAPNPVYVSVGHKISLKSAVWLALECCQYRIPEPIRRADLDSREYISKGQTEPYLYMKLSSRDFLKT